MTHKPEFDSKAKRPAHVDAPIVMETHNNQQVKVVHHSGGGVMRPQ